MATTFKRIKTLIEFSKNNSVWNSDNILASELIQTKNKDFKTSGNGFKEKDYMKMDTLKKLIGYTIELDLLEKTGQGDELRITDKGKKALLSDDTYKKQITSSVKNYLDTKRVPLTEILDTVDNIKLPELPDITTIYNNLKNKSQITEKELKKAMFLLSLSEGIDRKIKVVYLN